MVKSMPRGIISMRNSFLPLKKTITPLLISVSIFSLVLSWSSLSSLTLLHYQNLHRFSINYFHLISIAMSKNCIFLIFNGILVFLAKTSALLRPPPSDSDPDVKLLHKRIVDEFPEAETLSERHITLGESFRSAGNDVVEEDEDDEETKTLELQEEVEVVEEETHELQEEMEEVVDEESNERAVDQVLISIEENDEDEDKEDSNGEEEVDGEYEDEDKEDSNGEEEVDDEIEKLSNEELNKKFEDFIRRMKEEFKIDQYQQQQLVLVK